MNKKVLAIIAVIILALCGGFLYFSKNVEAEEEAKGSIEITHDLGTIKFESTPKKVVALDYGVLDVLDSLEIDVIGVPKSNTMPEYLQKYNDDKYAKCGTIKEPDLEAINEVKPEIIIISDRMADYYEELSKIAPTLFITSDGADYMNSFKKSLDTYGKVFNIEDKVNNLYDEASKKIEEFKSLDNKTASVVMVNGRGIATYGKESRFGLIFNEMGFKEIDENIEASSHGMEINFEYLSKNDPEYIFVIDRNSVTGSEDLKASDVMDNDLIKGTKAYKNNKIIYLNSTYWYTISGGYTSTLGMIDEVLKNI